MSLAAGPPRIPGVPTTALDVLDDVGTVLLVQAQWSGGMPYHRSESVPGTVEDPAALLPPGAQLRLDQRTERLRVVVAELRRLVDAVG